MGTTQREEPLRDKIADYLMEAFSSKKVTDYNYRGEIWIGMYREGCFEIADVLIPMVKEYIKKEQTARLDALTTDISVWKEDAQKRADEIKDKEPVNKEVDEDSKWISCKKQMPNTEVLLLTSSKLMIIGDFYNGSWRTHRSKWVEKDGVNVLESGYQFQDIIAWQPLPPTVWQPNYPVVKEVTAQELKNQMAEDWRKNNLEITSTITTSSAPIVNKEEVMECPFAKQCESELKSWREQFCGCLHSELIIKDEAKEKTVCAKCGGKSYYELGSGNPGHFMNKKIKCECQPRCTKPNCDCNWVSETFIGCKYEPLIKEGQWTMVPRTYRNSIGNTVTNYEFSENGNYRFYTNGGDHEANRLLQKLNS